MGDGRSVLRRGREHWTRRWTARRLGKAALIGTMALLTFEIVYRLVALPLDYVPEERRASLETNAIESAAPVAEGSVPTEPGLRLSALIQPARLVMPEPLVIGPLAAPSMPAASAMPAIAALPEAGAVHAGTPAAPGPAALDPAMEPPEPAREALFGLTEELAPPVSMAREPQLAAVPVVPRQTPLAIAPREAPRGAEPLIGIVIDDMGYSPASLRQLAAMPGPLTLAFLPYAGSLASMLPQARAEGFEIMLHLPMEPLGDADPGPEALLVGLDEDELRRRVRWALANVPRSAGVNNHMGSRFTADRRGLDIVMEELAREPRFFLDSKTDERSIAESRASAFGIPATSRNVFIDHVPEPEAIARQLALIERVARQNGSAIAIGHPYPATLAALESWLPTLAARGFRLARASEVIALRHCGDASLSPHGCRPGFHLAGVDARPAAAEAATP